MQKCIFITVNFSTLRQLDLMFKNLAIHKAFRKVVKLEQYVILVNRENTKMTTNKKMKVTTINYNDGQESEILVSNTLYD